LNPKSNHISAGFVEGRFLFLQEQHSAEVLFFFSGLGFYLFIYLQGFLLTYVYWNLPPQICGYAQGANVHLSATSKPSSRERARLQGQLAPVETQVSSP
jgi:hypothetical protein